MSWANVEAAIQAAIVSASGLADGQVFWEHQDAPQPPLDDTHPLMVSMSLGSIIGLGIDMVSHNYDGARPAGQEVQLVVEGQREATLQLQVFSAATVDTVSKATARACAEQIRGMLRLPTARDLMAAQDVVPFDPGTVGWVPQVVGIGFRGRATLDIRCYVPLQALVEYTTYVSTISGTVTAKGGRAGDIMRPFVVP